MKKLLFKTGCICCLICFLLFENSFIYGQETKLLASKGTVFNKSGKHIKITFCSMDGSTPVSLDKFLQNPNIYFAYTPDEKENWTFGTKDIDRYRSDVNIKQNETVINANEVILINPSKLVASFPKSQMLLIKPFIFSNDLGTSESLAIKEQFWPNYTTYNTYFTNGKKYYGDREYLKAYDNLQYFLNTSEEISSYSFYNSSRELMNKTINDYLEDNENTFASLCSLTSKTVTESQIEGIKNMKKSLSAAKISFNLYFDKYDISQKDTIDNGFKNRIENLSNNLDIKTEQLTKLFKKQVLSIFSKEKYESFQFRLYVDLLVKLYFFNDSVKINSGMDTINIKNIYKFKEDYEKLKDMDWLTDFEMVVKYINYDIIQNRFILNEEAISNLQAQVNTQPQPFFEIFSVINLLGNKDKSLFIQPLYKSYLGCTDEKLLEALETYFLFFSLSETQPKIISLLNEGLSYENVQSFEKAKTCFEKADRYVSNNPLALYYLGKTCIELNQADAAIQYFEKAEKAYPKFIMTRKYILNIYIENKEFDKALTCVNLAIENNPIWYYYFKKAEILYNQNKWQEAKKIILDNCIAYNPVSIDEYLLLGDICLELKDYNGADQNYNKVGSIDPQNKAYQEKLKNLREIRNTQMN